MNLLFFRQILSFLLWPKICSKILNSQIQFPHSLIYNAYPKPILSWFGAKQLGPLHFVCYVWHKMIFAWEQLWEQLSLLLFKPLLKCFANRLCLLVERIEPAVLVPGGTEAGWGIIVKVWHSTPHHKILYTIGTCKQFMGNEEWWK